MTGNTNNDGVGYRRPPKASRWKKGQSGNPRKVRGNNTKKNWEIIEKVFAMELAISEGGIKRLGTAFEAIVLRLWMASVSGDKRASRVLQRYADFAKTKPDLLVVAAVDKAKAAEDYLKIIREL